MTARTQPLLMCQPSPDRCTVVQHTFSSMLEDLRAQKHRGKAQASPRSKRIVPCDGGGSGGPGPSDPHTPEGRNRARKRPQSDAPAEAQGSPAKRPASAVMSKHAYAKAGRLWIDKFEDGKCSAEHAISKLKALLDKFSPNA